MSQPEWEVKQCRACEADIVYLRTKNGKTMPVDAKGVLRDDYQFDHARHTSHFATCSDPERFRKRTSRK